MLIIRADGTCKDNPEIPDGTAVVLLRDANPVTGECGPERIAKVQAFVHALWCPKSVTEARARIAVEDGADGSDALRVARERFPCPTCDRGDR